MSTKLYDKLIEDLEATLSSISLDLLSVEQGVKKNDDGSQTPYTRIELEVPRGNGPFSRCRFFCKLPPTNFSFTESDLDNGISVMLVNFKVTFISAQHEIYSRADSIQQI